MSVNLATKYSSVVDERFSLASQTDVAVNNNYDWEGVNSIYVYEVETAPMNNYTDSGTSRYGNPNELGDGTQQMVLTQDRSFTYTIDRKNYTDTMMTKAVGASLDRQIREVVAPERDQYRLARILVSAGYVDGTAITASNAYTKWLDAIENLDNNKVPSSGRIGFVSTSFFKKIKLDDNFVKASDLAQNMRFNGVIGAIDGIPIIKMPKSYMNGTEFIITHPVATTAPAKLTDYKVHNNPPGINGWLVEGRLRYDAFVRNNKKGAIAVQVGKITTTSTAGASGKTKLNSTDADLALLVRAGFKLMYKTASAVTAPAVGDDLSATYTEFTLGTAVSGTATHKIAIAVCDADGKCIIPGTSETIAVGA